MKLNQLIGVIKNRMEMSRKDGTASLLNNQTSVLRGIAGEIKRISSLIDSTNNRLERGTVRSIRRPTLTRVRSQLANVARRVIARRAGPTPKQGFVARAQPILRPQIPQEEGPQQQVVEQPGAGVSPQDVLKSAALLAGAMAISKTDFKSLVQGMISRILTDDVTTEIEKRAESVTEELTDIKEKVDKLNPSSDDKKRQQDDKKQQEQIEDFKRSIPRVSNPSPDQQAPNPSPEPNQPPQEASSSSEQTPNASSPPTQQAPDTAEQSPDEGSSLEPTPELPSRGKNDARPAAQTTKQDLEPGLNDPPPKQSSSVQAVKRPSFSSIESLQKKKPQSLEEVIGEAESAGNPRIYNYVSKRDPTTKKPVEFKSGYMPEDYWTIKTIMQKQREGSVYAIGFYQFIPTTFKETFIKVKELTKDSTDPNNPPITEDTRFDRKTQKIFYATKVFGTRQPIREYLEKPEAAGNDLLEAALAASQEWSGLPSPYQVDYKKGSSTKERVVGYAEGKPVLLGPNSQVSYYPPPDKANIPLKRLLDALEVERKEWQGLNYEQRRELFKRLGVERLGGNPETTGPKNKPTEKGKAGKPIKKAEAELTEQQEQPVKTAEIVPPPYQGQQLDDRSGKVAFQQQQENVEPAPIINLVDNSTIVNEKKKSAPQTSGPSTVYSALT